MDLTFVFDGYLADSAAPQLFVFDGYLFTGATPSKVVPLQYREEKGGSGGAKHEDYDELNLIMQAFVICQN